MRITELTARMGRKSFNERAGKERRRAPWGLSDVGPRRVFGQIDGTKILPTTISSQREGIQFIEGEEEDDSPNDTVTGGAQSAGSQGGREATRSAKGRKRKLLYRRKKKRGFSGLGRKT